FERLRRTEDDGTGTANPTVADDGIAETVSESQDDGADATVPGAPTETAPIADARELQSSHEEDGPEDVDASATRPAAGPDVEVAAPPPAPRPVQMPEEARIEVGGLPGRDALPEIMEPVTASAPAVAARRDAAGHALPRIMAVANQKGGVGKTTTTVNLAAALAEAGYRTLVVDLDPQGNASTGLGINIRDLQLSMYDVIIHEAPIDDTIEATSMKNLFVAPSSLDLAGAEIELVPAFSREMRLRNALRSVADDYDYMLIDCPPSLGLLTVNGLAAAQEVLVPIQCEYYALEGLGQLLRNVSLVQRNLNQSLVVSTFVCVMYDARTKLADQVVAEVRDHFGEKVCRIVIPRTVRLSEAPSYGQPILAFDPRSRGAIAYRELAREVSGGPIEGARP
ncbi:MAG TPA: AAA family ATPase, partial [Nocardioides sp.]